MNAFQFDHWLLQYPSVETNGFHKPLLMGVLNITPDSFSDGGHYLSVDNAWQQAEQMIAQGADIIDIGGESTKPGALNVSITDELKRVIPVIERIRKASDICISIDTSKPEVMEAAIGAGANIINDIFALQKHGALDMAARLNVPVCLMHMQGNPQDMQNNPMYPNGVVSEISAFFSKRLIACDQHGINGDKIILDPGFGFGKSVADNLTLVKKVASFLDFGRPLLLGASRKSTIGSVLEKEVEQRLIGGIALAVFASLKGVGIIRTHDVDETKQALHMLHALSEAP